MYRKSKSTQWRNQEIYAAFIDHLRNGHPVMIAYAMCARDYDLGEESIRKIVHEQSGV